MTGSARCCLPARVTRAPHARPTAGRCDDADATIDTIASHADELNEKHRLADCIIRPRQTRHAHMA